MAVDESLIPPPPIIRERLSKNIKERRLLRALLRLSVRAAEVHQPTAHQEVAPCSGAEGGAR